MKDSDKKNLTIIFLSFLVFIHIWLVFFAHLPSFVSSLNIFFHEAGHIIFSPFGKFIYILGGTLGELSVPIMFIIYFLKNENIPGEVFSWWWLGVALYDVSIYIADARSQILPLIGGSGSIHDWHYLLGRMHLLQYDTFISNIILVFMLIISVYMVKRIIDYKNV